MKKFIIGLLKVLGLTYVILFIVFYFDLDGKFLYYIWEPNIVTRYDKMKKKDNTKTPYEKKENVMPDSEVEKRTFN
ncbi:MAG: hypothetical protein K5644_00415 [Lachnospiraceae bacterium]|nr:hypothetical protein [Lachnospiraceae bacterium]